jgi:hypothetical protein
MGRPVMGFGYGRGRPEAGSPESRVLRRSMTYQTFSLYVGVASAILVGAGILIWLRRSQDDR